MTDGSAADGTGAGVQALAPVNTLVIDVADKLRNSGARFFFHSLEADGACLFWHSAKLPELFWQSAKLPEEEKKKLRQLREAELRQLRRQILELGWLRSNASWQLLVLLPLASLDGGDGEKKALAQAFGGPPTQAESVFAVRERLLATLQKLECAPERTVLIFVDAVARADGQPNNERDKWRYYLDHWGAVVNKASTSEPLPAPLFGAADFVMFAPAPKIEDTGNKYEERLEEWQKNTVEQLVENVERKKSCCADEPTSLYLSHQRLDELLEKFRSNLPGAIGRASTAQRRAAGEVTNLDDVPGQVLGGVLRELYSVASLMRSCNMVVLRCPLLAVDDDTSAQGAQERYRLAALVLMFMEYGQDVDAFRRLTTNRNNKPMVADVTFRDGGKGVQDALGSYAAWLASAKEKDGQHTLAWVEDAAQPVPDPKDWPGAATVCRNAIQAIENCSDPKELEKNWRTALDVGWEGLKAFQKELAGELARYRQIPTVLSGATQELGEAPFRTALGQHVGAEAAAFPQGGDSALSNPAGQQQFRLLQPVAEQRMEDAARQGKRLLEADAKSLQAKLSHYPMFTAQKDWQEKRAAHLKEVKRFLDTLPRPWVRSMLLGAAIFLLACPYAVNLYLTQAPYRPGTWQAALAIFILVFTPWCITWIKDWKTKKRLIDALREMIDAAGGRLVEIFSRGVLFIKNLRRYLLDIINAGACAKKLDEFSEKHSKREHFSRELENRLTWAGQLAGGGAVPQPAGGAVGEGQQQPPLVDFDCPAWRQSCLAPDRADDNVAITLMGAQVAEKSRRIVGGAAITCNVERITQLSRYG